jgi:hypothetical protein
MRCRSKANRANPRDGYRQSGLYHDPRWAVAGGTPEPGAAVRLALALVTRLALLGSIAWIVGLTQPLFEVFGHVVSWRYLILMGGGFFLLYKGTREIHHRLEGDLPGENELWRRHRANRAARHRALAR